MPTSFGELKFTKPCCNSIAMDVAALFEAVGAMRNIANAYAKDGKNDVNAVYWAELSDKVRCVAMKILEAEV